MPATLGFKHLNPDQKRCELFPNDSKLYLSERRLISKGNAMGSLHLSLSHPQPQPVEPQPNVFFVFIS